MQSTIIVVMGITDSFYQHAEFYYYQYDRRKLRRADSAITQIGASSATGILNNRN
jgi:hypothetical protein